MHINLIIFFILGTLMVVGSLVFILIYTKRIHYKTNVIIAGQIKRHTDEVKNIYKNMRGWKHDFHNHIQTMKAYQELNEYQKLTLYMDELDNDLIKVDNLVKCGNIVIDAILNSKVSLANSKSIKTDVTAYVNYDIDINDIDLCIILGNLIDNAIDACLKVTSIEERFIKIYISKLNEQFYINVTNSTNLLKRNSSGSYVSSKKYGIHGYGLLRIDKIINKYDGFIVRGNEPFLFATEILLPLSISEK